MPTTLIARAAELERAGAVLCRAAAGTGAALVVEGEPGLGKTRLLDEIACLAAESGMAVRRGAAEEFARGRPFGVLADAYAGERGDPIELLASVANGSSPAEAGGVQYRVTDALLDHIERATATTPLLLALDDLQWSDPASVFLVHALTRRLPGLPIALVVALRPLPEPPTLARLRESLRGLAAEHIRLRPLRDDAVTALLATMFGAPPGARLGTLVHRAGGNPFYLHELIRTLRDVDAITVRDGRAEVTDVTVPVTLGTTILRHLRYLSDDAHDLLRDASVLGTTFTATELAAVAGREIDTLVAPLREMTVTDLVRDTTEGFAFRHDLVREALYERIPRGIRRELHLRAGRALAAVGAPATRVALQFGLGAAPGDAEAISRLWAAAESTRTSAPDVAVGFLRQAIDLSSPRQSDAAAMRADLASLLLAAGDIDGADAAAREVLDGEHDTALDAVLCYIVGQTRFLAGRRAEWPTWLERAAASSSNVGERARLLAETATARLFGAGDLRGAERDLKSASDLGEQHAVVLAAWSLLQQFRGETGAATDSAAASVRLARSAAVDGFGMLTAARDPAMIHGLALLDVDRLDEAERAFRAGQLAGNARGQTGWVYYYHLCLGLRHYYAGSWDDAIAELATGLSMAAELGYTSGLVGPNAVLGMIAAHRDDLTAASAYFESAERVLAETGPELGIEWLRLGQATLAESRGDDAAAHHILAQAWDTVGVPGSRRHYRALGPPLSWHATRADDRRLATVAADHVEALAAEASVPGLTGAALWCRGVADADPERMRDAVVACRDCPRPLERAAVAEQAAAVIGEREKPGERRELLTEALATYHELGAGRDAARVTAALRSLGVRVGVRGRRDRPATGWDSLTPTELRIAALVAEGLSNPEIGTRLFISRRTVQTHVSHIFSKLGVSSRTELAAEATRHTPE